MLKEDFMSQYKLSILIPTFNRKQYLIKNLENLNEYIKNLNLIEKGKPKKIAITAVMRKILLTSMGVLKNQQPFDPNWAEKTRKKYLENLKIA